MSFRRLFLLILVVSNCLVTSIFAQTTYHWLNTSGGSYHTGGNWTPGGGPPLFLDTASFSLSSTYNVTFSNAGTQTSSFQIRGGNVTFQYFGTTAQHFWGGSGTNIIGPQAGDAATSATLNLTNMFNNPMMGHHLIIGNTAGKTGTLNIHSNGHWKGYSTSNVTVGSVGTGNLNISTVGILEKSILEANNIVIGTSGGTGNASVSGLNASMIANNVLTVGDGNNSLGNLTISNQGKVTVVDSLFVGVTSNKDNTVTVTGNGSELVLGNDTTSIGFGGKGRLWVLNGGKVTNTSSSLNIGGPAGSNGQLSISGAGSHFNSPGSQLLFVGASGQGTVDITGGGKMDVQSLRIGQQASGTGSVEVSGNGSVLNLNGAGINYIGEQGSGQLSVNNGAQINSVGSIYIGTTNTGNLWVSGGGKVFAQSGQIGGLNALSASSATVSGNGSLWSMNQGLDISWGNNADLQILSGGNVVSNGGRLGVLAGGEGLANISGTGSKWNTSGSSIFTIAQSGVGTLNIVSGGEMITDNVSFGSLADGVGTAKLSGANSKWTLNGILFLGDAGQGTLTIENGGKLLTAQTSNLRIGFLSTSIGQLNVTGSTSEIVFGTQVAGGPMLDVGGSGLGSLDVSAGGKILGGGGRIGAFAGSTGSAIVRNPNSQWNLIDDLNVGNSGTGSLSIQNGGTVSAANVFIGRNVASTGEVTLTGSNSNLTTAQNLYVGGAAATDGGSAELTVNPGTTVNVGNQLTLWSQGEVNLNGGKVMLAGLNAPTGKFNWNSGTVEFKNNTVLNTGLLDALVGTSHTLSNFQTLSTGPTGGLVVAPGFFTVDGGKVTGNNFTNVGTTSVLRGSMQMNGNFLNDVQGTFLLGGTSQISFAGTATNNGSYLLDGLSARSSGGIFTNHGEVSGRGGLSHEVKNHGIISVNQNDVMTLDQVQNFGHALLAGGRFNVIDKWFNEADSLITGHGVIATSTQLPGAFGLNNNGTIAVAGNVMDIHGDVRNTSGGKFITSGLGTLAFWDDVEHNGSEIRTSQGSSTVFYGEVTGAAPFTGLGAVYFEGDLKPGNSPANVLFEGDLYFGSSANLSMELEGLLAGSQHDRLTVYGDIFLNGQLSIDLIEGFLPSFGDTFLLIDNRGSNPLQGQFIGLDQGTVFTSGGHQFIADYFAGSNGRGFAITAVPEPTSFTCLILAAISFACRRRRTNHFRSNTI